MVKRTPKSRPLVPVVLTLLGMIALGILVWLLTRNNDVVLLSPKGFIAGEQRKLLIVSMALLMQIFIPTMVIFYFVAWKYRESNHKATYEAETKHGKSFVAMLWIIPSITALLMMAVLIPATYKLDPKKAIAADAETMRIQVVALRWKWLFIYPDQKIATVNHVQFPVNTPVQFELTADEAPMSSFWIPHLAGQLYAMTGHMNRLNVIGDTIGDYQGSSAEINGRGFAGMKFTTRVSSPQDFNQWVRDTKSSGSTLGATAYKELLVPSESNAPTFYANPLPSLYGNIIIKNSGSHGHDMEHE